ncbi:MAG: adenylate kinase family protein [Candidatus Bathyarchaeota archaeon]|nr:adenylate kinase family protein [Candidatus Bathyarchaeota archaeon]
MKRVILVTGTPCIGKTTTAKALAEKLNAHYINLTEFAKTYNLILGEDKQRKSTIIDEQKMRQKLTQTINSINNQNIVIDGHYAAAIVPTRSVTHVFVLRRNPQELKAFMEKSGYSQNKLQENLQAEILDVCLTEAIEAHASKVYELDITGKTTQEVIVDIMDVLNMNKKCSVGIVDWIGTLEREGILDEYLKT